MTVSSPSSPAVGTFRRRVAVLMPAAAAIVLAALLFHTTHAATDGTLQVTIVDAASSTPTPVRVRIKDAAGTPIGKPVRGAITVPGAALGIPAEALAVMYGRDDVADGFASQPDGAFYVDGAFTVALPPGDYDVEIAKGYEFVRHRGRVQVRAGGTTAERYVLRRWADMPARGWYSSDDHIHLRRSPREDPLILRWIAAEDIHVGHLLQMGDFFTTFFTQYAFGESGRYEESGHILSPGQEEPRTPEIGHTISLGASAFVRPRERDYYRYDRTFDRVRELGGVSGYAHQGATFHGWRGMTLDVLQRKIDFLELLQFCAPDGPLVTTNYYRFLDLGFPLTATAGSDFPWCGRNRKFGAAEDEGPHIGDARFYTYVDGPLTFDRWLAALKAGRTFVTTGPLLELLVDEALPGTTLERKDGDRVQVVVEARGHATDVPLRTVELVVHGNVIRTASATDAGQSSERIRLTHELRIDGHGLWVAARAHGGPTQVAHTTPVYIRANGRGFHNPATVRTHLEQSSAYLDEIEAALLTPGPAIDYQITRHPEALRERVAEVRAILERLSDQLR
ncbi:MAG: carboxypeptidase regulatory-like domain-containing protein [Acidobacteria bacterium]|nr:carboxypeptidase regulatory-like domain-containing protein [Acidobacteriota bacterium]